MRTLFLAATAIIGFSSAAMAETVTLNFMDANGVVGPAGTVTFEDSEYGLLLTPDLKGVPAGVHGFHVHVNPSCDPGEVDGKMTPGMAAGGHWDPDKTGVHLGPYTAKGHKGDLPALYAAADGTVTTPVLAPRLKAEELKGHALMLHVGGDNHSDHPAKLGGGGARLACGVM